MVREKRYTIFKNTDIERYLSDGEIAALCELDSKINLCRQQDARELLTAVVVENDWPEYEPVWQMIENRVECAQCKSGNIFQPSHNGSKHCKSGSIASGGTKAHCSCDVCF